ncbi:acetylornithine deacetylase [Paracoccus sp. PS-1]|uniref:acetylornithine deacetylase n=1 Tax=unclassified Paracoccus (in: a-proteobacteria) TaxID=2688777 RepID=UPI00048D07EA|nr:MULTISPECIES: acetylornithine deacetylase [unclassified Paracoccus (in: a-proteobacteria)]MDQ7261302.1 acetylornithine deacetylase [Paracoccus sp. PS1]
MSSPTDLLARLVGFPSVVGGPNGDIIGFAADYLRGHGIEPALVPGPEGDRWNLFASIGDASRPGYVLSGHLDVVPAGEPDWRADPFVLRRDGDRLIGRGACDMKGFVAAALAMVPELVAMPLSAPVHIALSYDEEAGCRGVPHLLAALPGLCAPPLGVIIGEPSGLVPVLAHKGKAALRLVATGVAGHSSRPDLGANAIHALLPALNAAAAQAVALQSGPQDPRFAPPWSSLQIGTVAGGQAVNIIPDRAEAQIEARAIHGVDPRAVLEPVVAAAGGLAVDWLSSYPALALDGDHPLARLLAELTGATPLGAVSYGTEAGLYQQAGIPAIICGPGDIARAHRPEEYLTMAELQDACALIRRLGRRLCP